MKEKMEKKIPLLVLIVLVSSITSCVSTGSSKLSQTTMENIIEGSSSTAEVVKMIGSPDVSLLLDKPSIKHYINRIMSIRVNKYIFSEDKYEVWTYYRWSYFAVDPLLIPALESSRISLLIFNSNGVCVKKFYNEEATFRF
jgi:hypothetical protein